MRTVSGRVVSSKPISLSKAASTLSSFVSSDNGASQALCAYLIRASVACNELKQLHKGLGGPRRHQRSEVAAVSDGETVAENTARSEVSQEIYLPTEDTEKKSSSRTENGGRRGRTVGDALGAGAGRKEKKRKEMSEDSDFKDNKREARESRDRKLEGAVESISGRGAGVSQRLGNGDMVEVAMATNDYKEKNKKRGVSNGNIGNGEVEAGENRSGIRPKTEAEGSLSRGVELMEHNGNGIVAGFGTESEKGSHKRKKKNIEGEIDDTRIYRDEGKLDDKAAGAVSLGQEPMVEINGVTNSEDKKHKKKHRDNLGQTVAEDHGKEKKMKSSEEVQKEGLSPELLKKKTKQKDQSVS